MKIYQVDAFTDVPFKGNPAAVCFLEQAADELFMQNVAAEMNLSETAFLIKEKDGYLLRWFTPTVEVDLCGHATLASAHILWEKDILDKSAEAKFYTKSGVLTAKWTVSGIELNFPATPAEEVKNANEICQALGVDAVYSAKNQYDYLVEIADIEQIKNLKPDFGRLAALTERGVIVTSADPGSQFDFVSRFFAPAAGINEDPVTGSAHCTLGPHWATRLNKSEFLAYQASERGGVIHVSVRGERTLLAGKAVTVLECDLLV